MALYYSDNSGNLVKVAGNYEPEKNIEHFEVIYDKDSSDSNLNWGYTAGIITGDSETGYISHDFTKYKRLRVYYCAKNSTLISDTFGRNNIIEIDLSKFINFEYSATNIIRYAVYTENYTGGIIVKVNESKTSFAVVVTDNIIAENKSFVYKIEGVY